MLRLLPFRGSKRTYKNEIKRVFDLIPESKRKQYIIIDLFGGSGSLALYVKQLYPDFEVVYNDYDNFITRVESIPQTNDILTKMKELITDIDKNRDNIIKLYDEAKDKQTILAAITFNGNGNLKRLYNRIPKTLYNDDIINLYNKLIVEHLDYKDCLDKYIKICDESDDNKKLFLLLDPPYMNTDNTYYKKGYFNICDYMEVIRLLYKYEFMYFEDERNDILKIDSILCDVIGRHIKYNDVILKKVGVCGKSRSERMIYNIEL